jgi:uncharacterized protein (TIGR00730 family)
MVKKICVFCGSNNGKAPEFATAAKELGCLIAQSNIELIYGGGKRGIVGALSRSVIKNGGNVTGIVPKGLFREKLINKDITSVRFTETMHQRKALMSKLADAFIVMPGGIGTLEEFAEVFTWIQLGIHSKPLGLLNTHGYYRKLLDYFKNSVVEGFFNDTCYKRLIVSDDPKILLEKLIGRGT